MAKPYSQDFRERLARAVLAGQSRRKAARGFDVGASCAIKLMQQFATTGGCGPRKFGGHKRHALAAHEDKVRALVTAQPDPTIAELRQKPTALEIEVGRSAVGRFLRHLQLTFKKNPARRGTGKTRCPALRQAQEPVSPGARCRKVSILKSLYSSTRPGPRPT